MRKHPCLAESIIALCVAALCVLVAMQTLGYGAIATRIPAAYEGDGLYYGMLIKGVIDSGWYLQNPWLGAPFGLDMGPFPMADDTHFAMIRMLGLVTGEFGATLTLFTLGSYATAAISAYAVMRLLGLGRILAAVGAFLFSLQAYHFWRGGHLFLASYFSVPIFVGVAMALYRQPASGKHRWIWLPGIAALLLLASGTGVYYAFFGCLLIGFAAIAAGIEQKRWRPFVLGAAAGIVILLGTFANLAPHLASIHRHFGDEVTTDRKPSESEYYGLRFVQMALPSLSHRRVELRERAQLYEKNAPYVNENATAALGLLALSGFILSILTLLMQSGSVPGSQARRFGALNAVAFGYATVGGLGTTFAWLVTAQFRGLNRISIVIAFISLCALLTAVQTLGDRIKSLRLRHALTALLAMALAVFGFWDQVPDWNQFNLARANQVGFEKDEAAGKAIERALPAEARVYQLPHVSFPEAPPVLNEGSHGLARRYLHTRGIAWSYGAMRGRESDQWIQVMETIPLPERIARLAAADFDAVLVERAAYVDGGVAIEQEISALLGAPILICPDRSCALFRIEKNGLPAMSPLVLAVRGSGFLRWSTGLNGGIEAESAGETAARMFLLNPTKHPIKTRLRFTLNPKSDSTFTLRSEQEIVLAQDLAAGSDHLFDKTIDLDPGITTLMLSADPTGTQEAGPLSGGYSLGGLVVDAVDTPQQEREMREADRRREGIFSDREIPEGAH
ncbi:MAG TPA: hypothetical protein PLR28_10675 [Dokdonella sp.]|nr:hypothetical protein [Dokdonella sp.]